MTDFNNYNPYQTPQSEMNTPEQYSGELVLLESPNSLSFGDGFSWLGGAWQIFMERPLLWLGAGLIHLIVMTLLALIPFVGGIIMGLIAPTFLAGMAYMAYGIESQEEIEIGDLFVGFKNNFLDFILLFIWQFLLALALVIPVGIVAVMAIGGLAVVMGGNFEDTSLLGILMIALVVLLCVMPLILTMVFSPILIVFHQQSAWTAMKLSLKACLANLMPFLSFGIVALILIIISAVTFGLAGLVITPLISISTYIAYRQILTAYY